MSTSDHADDARRPGTGRRPSGWRRGARALGVVATLALPAACGDDPDDGPELLEQFEVRTFVSDDGLLRCHELDHPLLDEPRVPCAQLREPPTVLTLVRLDDDPTRNASVLSLPEDWRLESARLGDRQDLPTREFDGGGFVLAPPVARDGEPIVIFLRFAGDRYSCIHVEVDLDCGFRSS